MASKMLDFKKMEDDRKYRKQLRKIEKEKKKLQEDLQKKKRIDDELQAEKKRRADEEDERQITQQILHEEQEREQITVSHSDSSSSSDSSDLPDVEDYDIDMRVEKIKKPRKGQPHTSQTISSDETDHVSHKRKISFPTRKSQPQSKSLKVDSKETEDDIRHILKSFGERIASIEQQLKKPSTQNHSVDDEPSTSANMGKSAYLNLRGKWIPDILDKLEQIHQDVKQLNHLE